jgi:hypothetical protein
MGEIDDRLEGDLVWELFAHSSAAEGDRGPRVPLYQWCLAAAVLLALARYVSPAVAVVAACCVVSARDVISGRHIGRLISDKAGGSICAWFSYGWGAWKFGAAGFAVMFISLFGYPLSHENPAMMQAFATATVSGVGGFMVSAILTALGVLAAYCANMRIWIGEGVNQARALLTAMLIVLFVVAVLGPICVWLAGISPRANDRGSQIQQWLVLSILFGSMFVGSLGILLAVDRIGPRVIAERPGKFGPKVPTVGKWNL